MDAPEIRATTASEREPVPPKPERGVRKIVTIPHDTWAAIDDLRFERRYRTDQDVLLALIEAGLAALGEEAESSPPPTPAAPRGRGGGRRKSS